MKHYLNFIMNDKSVIQILKLRTGNHILFVETDRYKNRRTYNERTCNLCSMQKIQDLHHVIIECPKFNEQRSQLLKFLTLGNKNDFYYQLSVISEKQMKSITTFMEGVQETIQANLSRKN